MILVVGATGQVGGAITRTLLAQNQPVRSLARPQSDYRPLAEAGAEVVMGDLKDISSLDAACRGVQTVITTANSARRGAPDTPETVEMQGNRNLIDAAGRAGVQHFIFVSALVADSSSPVPFLRGKGLTDEYLKASGMNWTILAPDAFMEAWPGSVVGMPVSQGRPVTLVGQGERKHSWVSARDVVGYAVAAVNNPAARNRYLPIGGPEALSWREVVEVYERVLERRIEVRFVPPGQPVPGLPETMSLLLAAQESYDTILDMAELSRTFGVRPTSLEEVVRSSMTGPAA